MSLLPPARSYVDATSRRFAHQGAVLVARPPASPGGHAVATTNRKALAWRELPSGWMLGSNASRMAASTAGRPATSMARCAAPDERWPLAHGGDGVGVEAAVGPAGRDGRGYRASRA